MGDEDTVESNRKLLSQRRPKIIIRKCKKPSKTVSKQADDSKKVNGELQSGNKNEADDEVEIIEKKEQDTKPLKKVGKRKASVVDLEDDDCTIIETNSPDFKTSEGNDGKEESHSLEFKGFKKRILAQTEKLKDDANEQSKPSSDEVLGQEPVKTLAKAKLSRGNKGKKKNDSSGKKKNEADNEESQAESQAEYAQYLGLQPTMQFKCYRCGEKGFPSMLALNMHQRGCGLTQKTNFLANIQQDTSNMTSSDPNMLTNFRITRKVYLCSACGTYYENWNLFLHMRDVHKKHICLYCLTMFTVANKLADHLQITHSVQENNCKTSEEFQNTFKGSCYLICCACENMFTERDDYHHHECMKKDPTAKCPLCGVKCGHYYTCPNSNLPRSSPVSVNPSPIADKSQTPTQNKPIPKTNISDGHWMSKKGQGALSSDNDDDYDISHAASFCHVDIADESGEKNKTSPEDNVIDITDDETPKDNSKSKVTNQGLSQDNLESNNLTGDKDISDDTGDKDIRDDNLPTSEVCENESENPKVTSDAEAVTEEKSNTENQGGEKSSNEDDKDEQSAESKTSDNATCLMDSNEEENNTVLSKTCEVELSDNKEENQTIEVTDSEKVSSQEETNPPSETQESGDKPGSDENITSVSDKSQTSPQEEKAVDTDGDDPATNVSVSQDDTESSSESSSDEEDNNKTNENSAVQEKNTSACDSDDSEKSGLIVDGKHKIHSNQKAETDESKIHDTASGDESLMEAKSNTSNEASKDFLLDDASSLEKPNDNHLPESEAGKNIVQDEQPPLVQEMSDGIPLAGEDVPAMALTLEDKLEVASPQAVVKECVRTSCLNCVYCSHAIKIAVNGKQLALHLLAEHRYKPIKNNETSLDVIKKLKTSLADLENLFFNTESYDSSDKSLNNSYDHTYECFQCHFVTSVHKELYIHKRKMHQKTVLLCVMCKSNFYSYSELLCHMCPGIYVSDDVNFRCCFCTLDMIPSAFRLMVHLRKSHHTCDICLEVAGDQQKLSTHMWKHKLNHLCYRCGIAYRNKPDITKHLFWKHGTESVLCKKCLQKKWPHVYHFCIPPTVFICEECNASFSKAVALKVHKRFHAGEFPYSCCKCDLKFVSKKLLSKHDDTHNKPLTNEKASVDADSERTHDKSSEEHINVESIDEQVSQNAFKENASNNMSNENEGTSENQSDLKSKKKKKKDRDRKGKAIVDVYDLPPLNLSSESDSSDEESKTTESTKENQPLTEPDNVNKNSENETEMKDTSSNENIEASEETQTPAPVVDGVWDNFHTYKAELEKRESKDLSLPNILPSTSSSNIKEEAVKTSETPAVEPEIQWFLLEHSYCLIPGKPKPAGNDNEPTISEPAPAEEQIENVPEEIPAPRGHSSSIDHAYATTTNTNAEGISTSGAATEVPSLEEQPSTPPPQVALPAEPHTSPKKKLKTPKKKKHSANSSSSSDDSSDSDSSSCTCGPDCSCSNTSSSSTSSSSDSESSTSEGRQRAAVKREKKKDKLKHKHHIKEETDPVPEVIPAPPVEEEPIVDTPVETMELPVRESDLDTDESSTDEDFYDKCPQSHAKQQIENRNKLMLLASVAPVNNGTVSPPPPPPTPPVEEKPPPPTSTTKRKIKTKRRRKSQQSKKQSNKANSQPNQIHTNAGSMPMATSTPSHMTSNHQNLTSKVRSPLRTAVTTFQSELTAGSGSENESARLSKRKRVRNKFYGYSSDEEEEKPSSKWRKTETSSMQSQMQNPGLSFQQTYTHPRPQVTIPQIKKKEVSESSGTEEEQVIKKDISSNTSSSSSESENEGAAVKDNIQKEQTEKSDNLYCYCQCPYDEVSEMIACDGQDCTIEWFHFECVGIMVPPKGKWYCPDCRKRRDLM